MAFKLTKLQAVNNVLSNIGQSPVTTLDAINPAVQLAEGMIDEVSHALQSEKWSFNTEQDYEFTPENDGSIQIPDNILSLDTVPWSPLIPDIRNGKLYDKAAHTSVFTDPVYLEVTWFFDFEQLPEVFKQYITVRAANLFAARAVGSAEVVKYSEREEMMARAACMEYETRQGDYNVFNDIAGNTSERRYLPYDAIIRR